MFRYIGSVFMIIFILSFASCSSKSNMNHEEGMHVKNSSILYYTCGMHPSVRVSEEEYKKGKVNCPICNMKLIPVKSSNEQSKEVSYYGCGMEGKEHVFLIQEIEGMSKCPVCGMPLKKLSKEEADKLKGVIGQIKIGESEANLAGIKTEPVKRLSLYKDIRTVGKIAYDPELAIAEEEFISSLVTLDKMKESQIHEIQERAISLKNSAKRKLQLLGLSEEHINELEEKREVHTSLLLPEEKMWVYGDIYQYELSWIKDGDEIIVTTVSFPGEEFKGNVSSINPVFDQKTRSLRFRAEVKNPDLKLKPEMYVDVDIRGAYKNPKGESSVLAIPKNAVLDTGTRKIVWIDNGNNEYEGREVKVGPEAVANIDGKEIKVYPVLIGLSENELVVTKANFLIDSQSQITGVAASSYGGSLDKSAHSAHQH